MRFFMQAALTLAVALSVHAQEPPAPRPRRQLAKALWNLAPEGDKALSFREGSGKGTYVYFVKDLKDEAGAEQTLVEVQAASDDQLAHLTNGGDRQWSPDGARVGVVTVVDDVPRCGIASLAGGEARWFEAPSGTSGVCFAPEGGGGWFVEGSMRAPGVKVRTFDADGKAGDTVFEDANRIVALLEPSPKGTHLALLISSKIVIHGKADGRPVLMIGVLDLATKELVESDPVKTDDHFLKPRLRWLPDGSGLVLTTRAGDGKFPANVVRCDAATGALHTLVEAGPWAVASVLADGQVCLYDRSGERVALLDPKAGGAPRLVDWPAVIVQKSGGRSLLLKIDPRGWWID